MSIFAELALISGAVLTTALLAFLVRRSAAAVALLTLWLLLLGGSAITLEIWNKWPLTIAYSGSLLILAAWVCLIAVRHPLLGSMVLLISLAQPFHAIFDIVPRFPWLSLLSVLALILLAAARGWKKLRAAGGVALAIWFCQASLGLGLPDAIAFWITASVLGLVATALGQRLAMIRQIRSASNVASLSGVSITALSLFALGDPGIMNEAYLAFPTTWPWFTLFGLSVAFLGLINLVIPAESRQIERKAAEGFVTMAGLAGLMLLNGISLTGILPGWVLAIAYRLSLAGIIVWLFRHGAKPGFTLLGHVSLAALLIAAAYELAEVYAPAWTMWAATGVMALYGAGALLRRRQPSSAPTARQTPIPPRPEDR